MCDEEKDDLDILLDNELAQAEEQYEVFQAKIEKAVGLVYECIIGQILIQLPGDIVEVCEFNFENCKKLDLPSEQKKILAVWLQSYDQNTIEINYRRKHNKMQTRATLEVEFSEDAFILVKEAIFCK